MFSSIFTYAKLIFWCSFVDCIHYYSSTYIRNYSFFIVYYLETIPEKQLAKAYNIVLSFNDSVIQIYLVVEILTGLYIKEKGDTQLGNKCVVLSIDSQHACCRNGASGYILYDGYNHQTFLNNNNRYRYLQFLCRN